MRKPSPVTDARNLRGELKRETAERQMWQRNVVMLRGQLTKAQQDATEWKCRFDALLARVPMKPLEPGV